MTIVPVYDGPQCPRCNIALTADWIRSGAITCPYCNRSFEATAFEPPQLMRPAAAPVMTVDPEAANACANHARNAATASCQRCGLFICALCDMNVGAGSYCPACFERVRTEGTLQAAARRYRDHASMARTAVVAGLLFSMMPFFGLPFGPVAMFYAIKARRQRRDEGRSVAGVTFMLVIAVLETLGSLAMTSFMLWALVRTEA